MLDSNGHRTITVSLTELEVAVLDETLRTYRVEGTVETAQNMAGILNTIIGLRERLKLAVLGDPVLTTDPPPSPDV